MSAPQRLQSETFTLLVSGGDALPSGEPPVHELDVSLAWLPDGTLHDVIFVGRGKIGHGLDMMLTDLGIQISRAIQGRDPLGGQ